MTASTYGTTSPAEGWFIKEYAIYRRKSPNTIRNWIKWGWLPAEKVGRDWWITPEADQALLNRCQAA